MQETARFRRQMPNRNASNFDGSVPWDRSHRRLVAALLIGTAGIFLLPWYQLQGDVLAFDWLGDLSARNNAPVIFQSAMHGHWWLLPLVLCFFVSAGALGIGDSRRRGRLVTGAAIAGFSLMVLQGFAVGPQDWAWNILSIVFGPLGYGQGAMGAGAAFLALSFVLLFSFGLAEQGVLRGDAFVIASIAVLVVLVAIFVFYPLAAMFAGAFKSRNGSWSAEGFTRNIQDTSIWNLSCLWGGRSCGVAWRTLWLALCTAAASTCLGLVFALMVTRTGFRAKRLLRMLTILPIITPPFVIGLALIMMFGRAGVVTVWVSELLDIVPGRWLYGSTGIWIAQVLSFTPVSFLVLIGVVEGISPSMEEASQTLRSGRWRTFTHVSLPLMRPGLANAFLIAFIESMADFGNPLVLGGSQGVLSTEIFFAVVGAKTDPSRAAVLAIILLTFTLGAFMIQRLWLAGKEYATVTGKADNGIHGALPVPMVRALYVIAVPWVLFTVSVYGMIAYGGFVKTWGFDNSLTLEHYARAFSITVHEGALLWTGVAWPSFWTTMKIALIASPLTAAVGLLTAYLIVRQKFVGRGLFEFGLMLSFAIPGTVIGISYVMAFNMPPVEITGTALVLIACFVFRNMPVGVRGGIAAMSQLDKSLDEASLTLRSTSLRTVNKVILPLLRPALTAALVISFVRTITSVSAVVFLVSAQYNMATSYIVGLVENGQYGVAIAYSSALIVVMIVIVGLFQLLVGQRKLRRENRVSGARLRQEKTA